MSSQDDQNINENLCVLCFKNVETYSIGVCDHPVCYECSTRMRILCEQNECPICRREMPTVVFNKTVEPFTTLYNRHHRSNMHDRKAGLLFASYDIQKAYYSLLEHRCNVCGDHKKWPFKTFAQLRDHMRKEHELFYCDICVEHVRIFTWERRTYTRQELGLHRRKGDPDNTSHRGHPLCEFCDTRFLDSDELFRHLRRNHLFCHFCDADGKHQYYKSVADLTKHFQEDHYFCDEGECKSSPMTAAYRTDIDLKAHIAAEHSRFMTKSATKQARLLDLEITLAPRNRPEANNRRPRDDEGAVGYDESAFGSRDVHFANSFKPQDFPALNANVSGVQARPATVVNFSSKSNKFSDGDFPSLGSSSSNRAPAFSISTNSGSRAPEISITKKSNNFPALGKPSTSSSNTVRLSVQNHREANGSNVSIHFNHKPNGSVHTQIKTSPTDNIIDVLNKTPKNAEMFPALGKTSNPTEPQWVQIKSKKNLNKPSKESKVAAAPDLTPTDQFPELTKNKNDKKNKNESSASNIWVNLKEFTKSNKNTLKSTIPNQNSFEEENANRFVEEPSKSKKKKNKKSNINNNNNSPFSALSNEQQVPTTKNDFSTNGLVKKRSEIKIEPVEVQETKSRAPPPGFNVKPPPGFDLGGQNFPSLNYSNDLTFTTSSGESYFITPSNGYRQPNNFTSRNQAIMKRMAMVSTEDAIQHFKTDSDKFRTGVINAEKYYQRCRNFMAQNFEEFFPELLVLLPDVHKQQSLYDLYAGKSKKNLVRCENCGQIISKNELSEHYAYHSLDSQFGELGLTVPSAGNNAWKK